MAIAFDNKTGGSSNNASSTSFSHTTTGSNRLLIVIASYLKVPANLSISVPTYNGVSMTQIQGEVLSNGGNVEYAMFYLLNPASGANTLAISISGSADICAGYAFSYTGVLQAASLDDSSTGTGATAPSNMTGTVTTTVVNDWGFLLGAGATVAASTNSTLVQATIVGGNGGSFFDTSGIGGFASTGSNSMTVSYTSDNPNNYIIAAFKPAGVTATAHNLTLLGTGS